MSVGQLVEHSRLDSHRMHILLWIRASDKYMNVIIMYTMVYRFGFKKIFLEELNTFIQMHQIDEDIYNVREWMFFSTLHSSKNRSIEDDTFFIRLED